MTGVTLVGDTVFLCAANTDAEGDHNPGVVLALRLDRQQQRLEPRALIRTTAFNPTGLTRFGSLLFVTNTGSFGQTGASIDVIDVQSAKRLSSITFPELLADGRVPDPFGPVVVEPSGRSGYVGSLQQARLYALDLQALTFREDFTLPSDSTRNSTRGLALSSDGTKVFAANAGDSAVNVLDVEQKQVTQVSGLRPASEGQVEAFVVKPAPDGKGDTVLAVVGDVPVQDRAKPEVSATLDRVTLQ